MERRGGVPHHQIAHLVPVPVDEARRNRMGLELVQQGEGLLFGLSFGRRVFLRVAIG